MVLPLSGFVQVNLLYTVIMRDMLNIFNGIRKKNLLWPFFQNEQLFSYTEYNF